MISKFLRWGIGVAAATLLCAGPGGSAWAQRTIVAPASQAVTDAGVEAAEEFIGRALILREFSGERELVYNADGRVQGEDAPERPGGERKMVDWTLAGFNLEKVTRHAEGMLALDGTRVAIRYNPEQHVFERHPQKEERLQIKVTSAIDAASARAALAAIFSVGIDPALERSTPSYWAHYFFPSLAWPADDGVGEVVVLTGGGLPAGMVMPVDEKSSQPEYSAEAQRDRVRGSVRLQCVVGTDGLPRRILIRQPLGYGLDARAIEALAKSRFQPGTQNGRPVAVQMILNEPF